MKRGIVLLIVPAFLLLPVVYLSASRSTIARVGK
jgi:hypothetical protein